jgi:hypothetical protein
MGFGEVAVIKTTVTRIKSNEKYLEGAGTYCDPVGYTASGKTRYVDSTVNLLTQTAISMLNSTPYPHQQLCES